MPELDSAARLILVSEAHRRLSQRVPITRQTVLRLARQQRAARQIGGRVFVAESWVEGLLSDPASDRAAAA